MARVVLYSFSGLTGKIFPILCSGLVGRRGDGRIIERSRGARPAGVGPAAKWEVVLIRDCLGLCQLLTER